ncbi:hypothetical protein G9A89_012700 [Geosiphon pyriformis]|nr:hypothetical protein G9A89_012700 [Geosiphon pyriformis]
MSAITVVNKATLELTANFIIITNNQEINIETLITVNISTIRISTSSLSTTVTNNISTTTATNNLSDTHSSNTTIKPSSNDIRKPQIKSYLKLEISNGCSLTNPQFIQLAIRITTIEFRNWNYLSLLAISEDALSNTQKSKQKQSLTNIPPATVMEDESLAAIFPFKIEELTETPLFSKATLEKKPIMVIYTDAKINVDRAASARIITTNRATKTPIGEIDNLPIEINGITIPIKVLVMEATQYQTLVGNNWLFKINVTLDWNTQELQLSQNRQHTHVSAMCDHFKSIIMSSALLIKFKEEKEKPT